MKKIVLLSLLVLPAILLASGHGAEESRYFLQTGRESDFIPRIINFTVFAMIIYYLLANPIKMFFKGRSEGVSSQLNEIEAKLNIAKTEQNEAQSRLDESQKRAEEIIEDAKNEAIILAQKIVSTNENDLVSLEKQAEEKIALEEKKVAIEAIDEVLSENITSEDILIDTTKVIDIISKKVA